MSVRLRSLGFRLANDNNAPCAAMWIIAAAWLLVNIFVFGLGSPTGFGGARSFLAEARGETPGLFTELLGWLRFLSWWGWVIWLPATVIYTPIAFLDEFQRAKESWSTRRSERGSQTQAAPGGATGAAPAGQRALTFRDFLKWEFVFDFGAMIVNRLFRGGGEKR